MDSIDATGRAQITPRRLESWGWHGSSPDVTEAGLHTLSCMFKPMVQVFGHECGAGYPARLAMGSDDQGESSSAKGRDPKARALGLRIRRLRKRVGMTRKDLADKLGVHENTLGTWERGQKQMRALDAPILAALLRTDLETLLAPTKTMMLRLSHARSSTAYMVSRSRIDRVMRARAMRDLRDLFNEGIEVGFEIEPDFEEVSAVEWGELQARVEEKLAKLGGIPEDW